MEEGFIINFPYIVGVLIAIFGFKFSLKFVKYIEEIKKLDQTYSTIRQEEVFKGME